MGAYDVLDKGIAGLKSGIDSRVVSRCVADTNGIKFGMPVFGYVGEDSKVYQYHNDRSKLALDADIITGNSVAVVVNGVAVTSVPFNGTHAQTMTDLIAQIEADITGANASLDSSDVNGRTLFIQIDGVDVVATLVITGGVSQATATITVASTQVFIGIALFTQKESAARSYLDGTVVNAASAQYDLTESINVLIDGEIFVVTADAVDANTQAYIVVTAGATLGKFTDAVGSNVIATGVMFVETVSTAGIAKVRINK